MALVRGGITVKPHVQRFADECQVATGANSYGTYPGHSPPEGPTQALDIFNSDDAAGYAAQDRIAKFSQANAKRLGVRYIIRREHIWNIERAAEGWRRQRHYGNRTKDHYDHVHITFYATAPEPDQPKPTPTPLPQESDDVRLYRFNDQWWITDGQTTRPTNITFPWHDSGAKTLFGGDDIKGTDFAGFHHELEAFTPQLNSTP